MLKKIKSLLNDLNKRMKKKTNRQIKTKKDFKYVILRFKINKNML